jgi:transposase-like protein
MMCLRKPIHPGGEPMTGLHRTPLTTSQKVECAAMALAGQEVHGTVSEISREFGISRPTVYERRVRCSGGTSSKRNPRIGRYVLRSMRHSLNMRWWGPINFGVFAL